MALINWGMQTFVVIGPPKPQTRPRIGRKLTYDPSQKYKRDFGLQILVQRPRIIESGPIGVNLIFYMPRPQSLKKSTQRHIVKPDLDNLIKAALDALNFAKYTRLKYIHQ